MSSGVPPDRAAQYPQAGHHLVPVQVGALQVARPVGPAPVVPPAVQQAPVIEGQHVACDTTT